MTPFTKYIQLVARMQAQQSAGRLSDEARADILAQHNRGVAHSEIGAQYGRTSRQIADMIHCMRRHGSAPVVNQREAFGYEGPRA